MTKKFPLLLFFLLIFMYSYSQSKITIKGLITDKENYPIIYAGVGIIKKNIGTTSTEEGTFRFYVTNKELNDTLEISSIGYHTYKVLIKDFINNKNKKIILNEKTTELSEISIMTTEEYVKKAIKSLKQNTISKNHQLNILYRRWSVEDNICRFYIEHFINVIDKGPSSYMRKYSIKESRKSSEYRFVKNLQNRHAIEYMEMNNPLRQGIYMNDYTWKKVKNSSYDGEDINIIEGVDKSNLITLFIGYDTYRIYRIEITRKPPKIGKYLHAIYLYKKNKEGKLYLSYHKREWQGSARIPQNVKRLLSQKNKSIGDYMPIAFRHEAYVLALEEDKKKFDTYETTEKKDMSLYEIPYNATFWNTVSLPPKTKFYTKNSKELESLYGVPIETQFKYSNQ